MPLSSFILVVVVVLRSLGRACFFDPRPLTDFRGRSRPSTSIRHSVTCRHTGKSPFPTIPSDGSAELRGFRTAAAFRSRSSLSLPPPSLLLSRSFFLSALCSLGLLRRRPGRVHATAVYLHPYLFLSVQRSSGFFCVPFVFFFPRLLLEPLQGGQSPNEAI